MWSSSCKVARDLGQGISFDENGARVAEKSLVPVSVLPVQKNADHDVQDRISQVFQLLVIRLRPLFLFFQGRGVRDRMVKKRPVLEGVSDRFFQR